MPQTRETRAPHQLVNELQIPSTLSAVEQHNRAGLPGAITSIRGGCNEQVGMIETVGRHVCGVRTSAQSHSSQATRRTPCRTFPRRSHEVSGQPAGAHLKRWRSVAARQRRLDSARCRARPPRPCAVNPADQTTCSHPVASATNSVRRDGSSRTVHSHYCDHFAASPGTSSDSAPGSVIPLSE